MPSSLLYNFRWFNIKASTAYHLLYRRGGWGIRQGCHWIDWWCWLLLKLFELATHVDGSWPILILRSTYLFFGCLLLDIYGNFSKGIMLSVLISRILICIPVVNHNQFFLVLYDKTNLISGKFYHLSWPQPLGISLNLFKPLFLCSFADAWVSVLLYLWMICWLRFILRMWARGHDFCVSYWFHLAYILIFPSLNVTSFRPLIF